MSWLNERDIKWNNVARKISKITGLKLARIITKVIRLPFNIVYRIKKEGFKHTIKFYFSKLKNK